METERELRVRKMQKAPRGMVSHQQPEKLVKDGVWLECSEDGKRCGDFEEWMVEYLSLGTHMPPEDVPRGLFYDGVSLHTPNGKFLNRVRCDLYIAAAISRVLQEADDG